MKNPTQFPLHDMRPSAAVAEAVALQAELTASLAGGRLIFPGYPEVAARIRKVLADDASTPERIGHVVASEPALAAKLMRMANSVALNPQGHPVTEIKSAVTRLGFNIVRIATLVYALSQVRAAEELRGLEAELDALWHRSALVAAICSVTADRLPGINPNEALLAGLLHNIGTLFLLSKAHKYPAVFADAAAYGEVADAWRRKLAQSLLRQWDMPESIIEAVGHQDSVDRTHGNRADLGDVLIVACIVAASQEPPDELSKRLQFVPALGQLALDGTALLNILASSQDRVQMLKNELRQ